MTAVRAPKSVPAKPATDQELFDLALRKAGDAAKLAAALDVQSNTPNQWANRLREGEPLSRLAKLLIVIYLDVAQPLHLSSPIHEIPEAVAMYSRIATAQAQVARIYFRFGPESTPWRKLTKCLDDYVNPGDVQPSDAARHAERQNPTEENPG